MLNSFRNSMRDGVQLCTGAPTERLELNLDTTMLFFDQESGGRTARPAPTRELEALAAPRQALSDHQSAVEAELSFSDHGSEEGKIEATTTEQDGHLPKEDC